MRTKFPLKWLSPKIRRLVVITLVGVAVTSAAKAQFPAPYCTWPVDWDVEPITLVNFAGINNTSSNTVNGSSSLEDFLSMTANVIQGQSYPISVKGHTGGNWTTYVRVFIDFNHNNSFADGGESFDIGTITNSNGVDAITLNGNITIPSGAMTGSTRMRVSKKYSSYPTSCSGTGGYGQSEDYTIIISSPCSNPTVPTITQGASVSRCTSDGPTMLSLTGTLNDATAWHWYSGSCGGTAVGTGTSISVSPATTTTYYVRGEGGCVTPGTCASITVNVSQAVSIITQPAVSTDLCSGGTLNLSVNAANATGYQWYLGAGMITDGNVSGIVTSGATTANLQTTNIPSILSGDYHVVITGASPCGNLQSDDAVVTVNDPVSISTQPSAVLSVCEGTAINLDVVASNTAGYQWYGPGGLLSDGSSVSGATTASLTVDPAAIADDGGYYVELMALPGCTDDQSITSAVSVTPAVAITTNTPATLGVCDGDDLNLSVVATNATGYQWYGPSGALTDGGDVSGAMTSDLTVANTTSGEAGVYYLEITGNSPCAVTTSTNTTVTNDHPAAITTEPTPVTACHATGTSISVVATGANLVYQWYEGTNMLSDNAVYSGTNSATLAIGDVSGLDNNQYSVEITGSCGSPVTSTTVDLTEDFDNTWSGATNNSWAEPTNWSCGIVPTMATNAIIPGVPNFCTVDIPTAECKDLMIGLGGMVLFNNTTNKLSIHGDVQNNGTFNGNNGTISLAGSGSQQVSGALTFDDLEIEGGGTKVINGVATINGELILTDGFLALGNNDLIIRDMSIQGPGNANSYVLTDGTGALVGQNMGSDSTLFPVGVAGTYNPVAIKNTGDADTFMVRVMEHVYRDGDGTDQTQVDNPVVDRTWMISEQTPGGSFASVTPQWSAGEEINGFDQNHVYVAHYMGGTWTSPVDSTLFTPAAVAAGSMWTAMEDSITSFSPFAVASHGSFPLVIRLTSISAVNVGTRNKVEWQSAAEEAGDVYELEHSTDGRTFTKIATVAAHGKPSTYMQWDEQASVGVNYYRAKLVGTNGKYSYSKVVTATVGEADNFTVEAYPNPVRSTVSVKVNGVVTGKGNVVVTDLSGRVVSQSALVEGNSAELNVSHLSNGMYLLTYTDEVRNESIKINKQ